jgi:hypothetical protein
MRSFSPFSKYALVLALVVAFSSAGCNPKAPPSVVKVVPKPAKPPEASATNDVSSLYVSVFENLLPPKGRDPFFPNSHRRDPAPPPMAETAKAPVEADLQLKGIVSSASHRQALINSDVMTEGEEDSVRVPNGHVRVRCIQIGTDYVIVQVEGEPQTKRLTLEQKHY